MMCNHMQSVAIAIRSKGGSVSIESIRAQIWFGVPKMAIERIRFERISSQHTNGTDRWWWSLEMQSGRSLEMQSGRSLEMQSGRSLEMQSALTIRMVQIDGGIARPDAPPTCLNHLIIDDHAYVAYPRTTVGRWARAHAV